MRALSVLVAALVATLPAAALAQPNEGDGANECISAYEQVQTLRDQSQLVEAREKAIVCASDRCPKLLSTECAAWLDQIGQSLPTIVAAATAPDGSDLVAVRVTVDGRPFAAELGARALPINPGMHTFSFESAELGTVEMKVMIREGEKNRRLVAAFDGKSVAPPTKDEPAGDGDRPVPVSVWVLVGAGGAAVITGAVFEALGFVKKGELEDCKPACAQEDVDEMRRNFVIGDVAIGVGAASSVAALIVYLTRPEVAPATPVVGPLPGGAFAGFFGRF